MRCINAFFIDITNIFVNMTDFSCHFNQKDALRIPNDCLCVILTYYFLLCDIKLLVLLKVMAPGTAHSTTTIYGKLNYC